MRAEPGGASGSWPSPRTMISALAPLSERNKTSVFVERAHRLELVEHAADLAVHAVDHRRVDGHLRRLERPLLGGQLLPGQRPVHLARAELLDGVGEGVRRADVALDRRQRAAHESQAPASAPALARGWRPSRARYRSR